MKKAGKLGWFGVWFISILALAGCEAASESDRKALLALQEQEQERVREPEGVLQACARTRLRGRTRRDSDVPRHAGIPCTGEAAQNCPLTCGTCNGGSRRPRGQRSSVEPCTGFQCASGLCIDNSKFCDGIWNCPDGDDESACDSGGSGGATPSAETPEEAPKGNANRWRADLRI